MSNTKRKKKKNKFIIHMTSYPIPFLLEDEIRYIISSISYPTNLVFIFALKFYGMIVEIRYGFQSLIKISLLKMIVASGLSKTKKPKIRSK